MCLSIGIQDQLSSIFLFIFFFLTNVIIFLNYHATDWCRWLVLITSYFREIRLNFEISERPVLLGSCSHGRLISETRLRGYSGFIVGVSKYSRSLSILVNTTSLDQQLKNIYKQIIKRKKITTSRPKLV